MKLYGFNRALSIVDLGDCDEDCALEQLKSRYEAGLRSYDSGEEAIEKTEFGLSRSADDFLEVTCNGQDSIAFHLDRLVFPSRLARIFSTKKHFWISVDRGKAREVIRDYFRMPRDAFEAKYQAYATR